jgi:hypothetical protein
MAGQPTLYKEEYCDMLLKHYDIPALVPELIREYNEETKEWETKEGKEWVANKIPDVLSFSRKIGIHRDTFYEWIKKHDEFSDTYKKCKDIAEDIWRENSMFGRYQIAYTIFYGKNIFNWKDKQEVQLEHVDTSKLKHLIDQTK